MANTKPKQSSIEKFLALSEEEKERIYNELDREFLFEETRPLTPAERRQWEAARRPGRPRKGEGSKAVSVTLERGLLRRADDYAKAYGLDRSRLIAVALEEMIGTRSPGNGKVARRRRTASPRKHSQ